MRPMEENPSSARFPTTCWSRVVAVRDRATPEALEALAGCVRLTGTPSTPSFGEGLRSRAGAGRDAGLFRPAARAQHGRGGGPGQGAIPVVSAGRLHSLPR